MERKTFAGLDVVIENPRGSVRQWHDRAAGKSGEMVMKNDYGFIADQIGTDGDEVDCYLGDQESAPFVYVVHQLRAPEYAKHDEDKVLLGFMSEAEAKAAYLSHRSDGDRAYGGMSVIPLEAFKAKLVRRAGTGKIRHEKEAAAMILMRIEQRGSEWVVLPENGDKVLGKHKTKAEAEAQLRAIEASKHAHSVTFEASRGVDGHVRTGVWDRICVPGHDEKDGESTDFNLETMSQMVANFAERGDPIPIDYNHQSNYARLNGQPAPALGFYGALAVVWEGQLAAIDVAKSTGDPGPGPDVSRDGLYGLRTEVTEIGDQLLPNFKLLSPTFTPQGVRRDGSECGYSLAAVAATNTPWQSGTEITFSNDAAGGATTAAEAAKKEGVHMSPEMLAKLGLEEGHSPEALGEAMAKYMGGAEEKLAKLAKMEEDEEAKKKAMESGAEPAEMAAPDEEAKKMDADGDNDGDEEKKMEKKDEAAEAKMATMEASMKALAAKVTKFEKAEQDREKASQAEKERCFEQLADQAVAGGYPKEARGALIKFARTDLEGARASVGHFLPKTGAPSHLFDRATRQGGPSAPGGDTSARDYQGGVPKARQTKAMGRNFIESDSAFADEIKKIAESKDPVVMEKLNKHLPEKQRSEMFNRLLVAEKIVRAERPDLAESAE